MTGGQPTRGRVGERGSAVVAVLVLLSAALLVVVGARLFGGGAADQLRCQGDAVRAIGSGSAAGCGDGVRRAPLGGSRLHAGAASQGKRRGEGTPATDDGQTPDPKGAREMLAPLFQIVESGSEVSAENQVTEEEFDEVVELFDDLREEDTFVRHTRAAAPYWDTIMADLALILQTVGGRELLSQLAYQFKWTFISVAFGRNSDGVMDPALGLDSSNAAAWYDEWRGYAHAEYAPGESAELPGADLERDPWAVLRSDVALYHELRHVLDFLAGTGIPGDLREDGSRVPVMEYQAVGLKRWRDRVMSENAYRAARREIGELGVGAVKGDADMPDRPRYTYRLPPADDP